MSTGCGVNAFITQVMIKEPDSHGKRKNSIKEHDSGEHLLIPKSPTNLMVLLKYKQYKSRR